MALRAVAAVNLAAIERNVAHLCGQLAPGARMCAVVKSDGYGHGACPAARAALAGGASTLAVATAGELLALRSGAVDAPVLVMGALGEEELEQALAGGGELVAWEEGFVARLGERAAALGRTVRVHVKLDTGMGRLGTRDQRQALAVAERVRTAPALELAGAMTHFATADDDAEFMDRQLAAFAPFVTALRAAQPGIVVHAANSAGTLRGPRTHFDLVRCGIAIYGADPMQEDPHHHGLEPALELRSYVAAVKLARPGESVGYGRRFIAERPTWIATIPVGYADGVRRALTNNCQVLIGGRRHDLVGTVSMDNVTVNLGENNGGSAEVRCGDPAILIGRDGDERLSAEEMAGRLGTINYEVLSAISARVPRHYHRDGVACDG